jgi:hypothetical protein
MARAHAANCTMWSRNSTRSGAGRAEAEAKSDGIGRSYSTSARAPLDYRPRPKNTWLPLQRQACKNTAVARYLARRLAFSLLLVVVVASAALVLTRLAPGDITAEQVGSGVSGRALAADRARLGLDRPLAWQYIDWVGRAVRLDFGTSLMYGRPVAGLVAERACNTALLAVVALLVATREVLRNGLSLIGVSAPERM